MWETSGYDNDRRSYSTSGEAEGSGRQTAATVGIAVWGGAPTERGGYSG